MWKRTKKQNQNVFCRIKRLQDKFLNLCAHLFSRENTYVRVIGHLKSFRENSRSLIAYSLNPVVDFNEITYHMIDVIHSHLALSKVIYFSVHILFYFDMFLGKIYSE